jgi:hypothetical protein
MASARPTRLQLLQRGVQTGQGSGAVWATRDDLGNHWIVIYTHLQARADTWQQKGVGQDEYFLVAALGLLPCLV